MTTQKLMNWIMVIVVTVICFSCSKEKDAIKRDENAIIQKLTFVDLNSRITAEHVSHSRDKIIIVRWSKWGRASRDCNGLGLCDAEWFPEAPSIISNPTQPATGGATILEYDVVNRKYYIDILLASFPPASISVADLSLFIDFDLELDVTSELGRILILKQGLYDYNNLLGVYGGYRIYLN